MSHAFLRLTIFIVIGFCFVPGAAGSASAQSGCKQQCVREAVKCVQYGTQCTQYQNRCARYDTKGRCLQQQQVCVQKQQVCTQQQKVCSQYQTVCPPQRQGNSGSAFQQLQKIERGQGGFDGQ
ncbi:MAG: hypothetical protein ACM32K_04180 [Syntrophaceae bacterium]